MAHPGQLGWTARPNALCGEGLGERIDSEAEAEGTGAWPPPPFLVSTVERRPAGPGWGVGCRLQGSRIGVQASYGSRPGPSPVRDGEQRDRGGLG